MKILKESSKKPALKNNLPVVFDNSYLLELITWAATVDGKNLTEPQMYLLVTEISELMNKRHRFMEQNEIKEAFRKGLAGDYGDYFGISIKSINHWLTTYKARKYREQEKEEIKNAMSLSERADFIRRGLINRGTDIKI